MHLLRLATRRRAVCAHLARPRRLPWPRASGTRAQAADDATVACAAAAVAVAVAAASAACVAAAVARAAAATTRHGLCSTAVASPILGH